MPHDLHAVLREFKQDDYAVRLSAGVASVLPFAEPLPYLASVEAAARTAEPVHADRVVARVKELVADQGPQSALGTADLLDKGDKGIALYSGVRTVYKAARRQEGVLETDPQQLADAALKAVGIAWMAWRLYPGSAQEKLDALWASPAGQALLAYYAAIDVALPFTDNILTSGGSFFKDVVDKAAEENAPRLAMAGGDGHKALEFLRSMTDKLGDWTTQAAGYVKPLTDMASQHLPKVMAGADAVAGVVATGADTLSVYRWLGGRMVMEHCVAQAVEQVRAEVAEEERLAAEAAAAVAAAEAARKAASGVKKDYDLDEGLAADSLANKPIVTTRSGGDELPARKGCRFCLLLVGALPLAMGTAELVRLLA